MHTYFAAIQRPAAPSSSFHFAHQQPPPYPLSVFPSPSPESAKHGADTSIGRKSEGPSRKRARKGNMPSRRRDEESDGDDDRKRKWMTKDQARAVQQKFEEYGGSLRGRQLEVTDFAKHVGLTPLQVEKRFHYIRKHYEKVTKRLTAVDTSSKDIDLLGSTASVFADCPAQTQMCMLQRVNDWAAHEFDADRIVKALMSLMSICRFGTEEVLVKPPTNQIRKLQSINMVPYTVLLEPATSPWPDLNDPDLLWLSLTGSEPFALLYIDSADQSSGASFTRWADLRLRGYSLPCFTVIPKGRASLARELIGQPWVQQLLHSVPGMETVRIMHEANMEYAVIETTNMEARCLDVLEVLFNLSEPLLGDTGSTEAPDPIPVSAATILSPSVELNSLLPHAGCVEGNKSGHHSACEEQAV